jgi:hypothetical protein
LHFNDFLNTIFSSPPTIALIIAVFLENTLEVEQAKRDVVVGKIQNIKSGKSNEEFSH